jgi:hypothetical protein
VTHGNDSSEALLRRLGFEVAADFDDYRRWHRALERQRPSGLARTAMRQEDDELPRTKTPAH